MVVVVVEEEEEEVQQRQRQSLGCNCDTRTAFNRTCFRRTRLQICVCNSMLSTPCARIVLAVLVAALPFVCAYNGTLVLEVRCFDAARNHFFGNSRT